jgi:hypothetical protein
MKITESKNLKHDIYPIDHSEGAEREDPDKSILESFIVSLSKIEMRFLNGGVAFLEAKNQDGYQEMEIISKKLNEMVGKSYKEILETDL